jgi:hypothetical protein
MSPPLDQHHLAPIEVSVVCTEGLVSTLYVPLINMVRATLSDGVNFIPYIKLLGVE